MIFIRAVQDPYKCEKGDQSLKMSFIGLVYRLYRCSVSSPNKPHLWWILKRAQGPYGLGKSGQNKPLLQRFIEPVEGPYGCGKGGWNWKVKRLSWGLYSAFTGVVWAVRMSLTSGGSLSMHKAHMGLARAVRTSLSSQHFLKPVQGPYGCGKGGWNWDLKIISSGLCTAHTRTSKQSECACPLSGP